MLTLLTIGGTGLSSPGLRTGKLTLPSQVISDSGRQGGGGSQEGGARGELAAFVLQPQLKPAC